MRRDLIQLLLGQVEHVVEKAKRDSDLDGDDRYVQWRSVTLRVKLTWKVDKEIFIISTSVSVINY